MEEKYKRSKRESIQHLTPEERKVRAQLQNKEACKRRNERNKAAKLGLEGPPLLNSKPKDDEERRQRRAACERERRRRWREMDPEGYSVYERARKDPFRDEIREKSKLRYQTNKEMHIRQVMEWQAANPDRCNEYRKRSLENRKSREAADPSIKAERYRKRRDRERIRRRNDPQYRISKNLGRSLRQALHLYSEGKKTESISKLIGCSVADLVAHIESLWEPWMDWSNYGRPKNGLPAWVIDHIRPCCSFDITSIEQQKICYHYSNLRPLEYYANIRKSGKL